MPEDNYSLGSCRIKVGTDNWKAGNFLDMPLQFLSEFSCSFFKKICQDYDFSLLISNNKAFLENSSGRNRASVLICELSVFFFVESKDFDLIFLFPEDDLILIQVEYF